jgi:hypothetical protein
MAKRIQVSDVQLDRIATDPVEFRECARRRVAFLRKLASYAGRQDMHDEESNWAGQADALEEAVRGLGDE